ncbi:MAG: aldehyde dehydrogenase family protein [Oscillospiraceae bacterium]|nr:aldehyde dehydrogenase family protein [Oscillospiraceae bacterium]
MMDFTETVRLQREFYESGITRDLGYRRAALALLAGEIRRREGEIARALQEDLGKPALEGYVTETGMVLEAIRYLRRYLEGWSKPRRVKGSLSQWPGYGRVEAAPYGTALVLSPWNYPLQLALIPLAEAMAAGNCVTLKPSEQAPATAKLIGELLDGLFEPCYIQVVTGGPEECEALTRAGFDKIFFTGSPAVGRRVMAAAAETLTPVTLELGGKSPCLVDSTADLSLAAKRIVWGKLLNAGQTCVAPDYVLVCNDVKEALIEQLIHWTKVFEGPEPLQNPDQTRIVSARHFDRLEGLTQGEKVRFGGQRDRERLAMSLAILEDPPEDSAVMQEEIFGPVLPVTGCENLEAAARRVEAGSHPLALYLFSRDKKAARALMRQLTFGGGCVNDTVLHLASSRMPFGGVGGSGMGACHGKAGFEAFSREKSVLYQRRWPDLSLRYRPYSEKKYRSVKKVMK